MRIQTVLAMVVALASGCVAGELPEDMGGLTGGSPDASQPSGNGNGTGNGTGNGNGMGNGNGGGMDASPVQTPVTPLPVDPACMVRPQYGSLGNLAPTPNQAIQATQGAQYMPGKKYYSLAADIEATPRQRIAVQLWEGYGTFAAKPVAPGTYLIGALDPDLESCGVCVTISSDYNAQGVPQRRYYVTSGEVKIDTVGPTGAYAGSLKNLTLREVGPDGKLLPASQCQAKVASATFSAPVVVQP